MDRWRAVFCDEKLSRWRELLTDTAIDERVSISMVYNESFYDAERTAASCGVLIVCAVFEHLYLKVH